MTGTSIRFSSQGVHLLGRIPTALMGLLAQVSEVKEHVDVGMATKRLTTTSHKAITLGMLAPAEGLTAFNTFVLFHSLKFGVLGVAPQSYWRLLLRDVMPKPSLFTFLYETQQDSEVCPLAFVAMWVPDVHVRPKGLPM